ncbi:integration host factor subunit alpha [Phenylobacterium sp.]|uniref:integration host factor subunit alpha n=1 Tax=Phenylobacterium sp. TaxID=1871053 RepID=UPI0037CBB135
MGRLRSATLADSRAKVRRATCSLCHNGTLRKNEQNENGVRAVMKGATVTRADLCESVHEQVGLTRQDSSELVERVLELMCVALENGKQVKLSGFGVFQVRAKRARMGRNPKTGEPAAIEPRRVIGFRASQVMKARVDRALSR